MHCFHHLKSDILLVLINIHSQRKTDLCYKHVSLLGQGTMITSLHILIWDIIIIIIIATPLATTYDTGNQWHRKTIKNFGKSGAQCLIGSYFNYSSNKCVYLTQIFHMDAPVPSALMLLHAPVKITG